MNLKHPYEKHLAEKLVQVPPPGDPDQNWQQMKAMLDEDMPRGGGGLPGAQRWIIPGIIILAIGSGIWFGGRQFLPMDQGKQSMAGTINKTHGNKKPEATGTTTTAGNEQAAGEPVVATTPNPANDAPLPATTATATAETTTSTPSETNQKELVAGHASATVPTDVANNSITTTGGEKPGDQKTFTRGKKTEPPLAAANNNNSVTPATGTINKNEINANRKKVYAKKNNSKRKKKNNRFSNIPAQDVAASKRTGGVGPKDNTADQTTIDPQMVAAEEESEETHFVSLPTVRLHKPSVRQAAKPNASVKESPVDIIVDYTGTSTITPSGVLQRNYTYYTSADLFPDLVVQKRGSRKSGRGYEGYEGKSFAIGISLPLGFPLGDQEPLAYNRQAGANTISDYIPSPHFQYHINHRTYFQTQIQLSTPQFIRPILLYRNSEPTGQTNIYIDNSVFARKLYYFNLPVSVYHSPMRNFYMGTGLQFSSMLSGVAVTEQRRRDASTNEFFILNQKYSRFSNDSLSRRFNNNEVRLLLDMNYFWNRFVVGLQYNQAFNNYVSFQMNSTSPYTFDKNKSLQFYLRYNIWEDKKRKPRSQTLLSLK